MDIIRAFFELFYVFLFVVAKLLFGPLSDGEDKDLGNEIHYISSSTSNGHIYSKMTWDYSRGTWDSTCVFIPPAVLSSDYFITNDYILAKQHPNQFDGDYPRFYQYPMGRDTTYYWLVNKKTKEQAGPLLYSEMELLLQEKGLERMLQNIEKGRIYLTKDEAKTSN
ncbi:MAG: hypothetical protein IJT13_01605 [Bacteroidaceae bacterium]|nr:hypothetical protein [Bacteroidaceae bacterium]